MDIEADLAEVSELCRIVRPGRGQGRMLAILQDLSDEDLRAAEPTQRQPSNRRSSRKRGLALMAVLNARLAPPSGSHAVSGDSEVKARLTEFESTLKELSERHLFQWSTYYRDWLARDFNWFLMAGERYPDYPGLLKQIHSMSVYMPEKCSSGATSIRSGNLATGNQSWNGHLVGRRVLSTF